MVVEAVRQPSWLEHLVESRRRGLQQLDHAPLRHHKPFPSSVSTTTGYEARPRLTCSTRSSVGLGKLNVRQTHTVPNPTTRRSCGMPKLVQLQHFRNMLQLHIVSPHFCQPHFWCPVGGQTMHNTGADMGSTLFGRATVASTLCFKHGMHETPELPNNSKHSCLPEEGQVPQPNGHSNMGVSDTDREKDIHAEQPIRHSASFAFQSLRCSQKKVATCFLSPPSGF